jgi:energy-coupling factor transporter transmembrane protein EcfT
MRSSRREVRNSYGYPEFERKDWLTFGMVALLFIIASLITEGK